MYWAAAGRRKERSRRARAGGMGTSIVWFAAGAHVTARPISRTVVEALSNTMAIQLTPEQEERIQAVVKAGAYPSAEEALDAAVAAVEMAAAPGFDGTR